MSITGFDVDDWQEGLRVWLEPFVTALGRSEQRHWAGLYVQGLLGPGARKSVEPMAERVCPGQTQQLHHFVAAWPWACEPLERVLRQTGDALLGGDDAVLIVDDTALPKQGCHSVGVKRQYCGVLGKQANCQVLVSLELPRFRGSSSLSVERIQGWQCEPRRARGCRTRHEHVRSSARLPRQRR